MASITISLDLEVLMRVQNFAEKNGIKPSKAAAILIKRGFASVLQDQYAEQPIESSYLEQSKNVKKKKTL